jgi:hypothetical protein
VKENQVCSNKGPDPLQRGEKHKNEKMGWGNLKMFFSRTTGHNFNQTWNRSFLGERDSSLFKRRG